MKRYLPLLAFPLILAGCGSPAASASEATPTATVTITASPSAEPAISQGAPQACLDALRYAEVAIGLASEVIGVTSDVLAGPVVGGFRAAADGDAVGLDEALSDLGDMQAQQEALTAQIDPAPYNAAAAACRAA